MAYSTRARETRVNYYSSPYGQSVPITFSNIQSLTNSLVAVKFNGKHTGNHKANNAQRLTEVKLTQVFNSFISCLVGHFLFQLFPGPGSFCCSRNWQRGDGLSCQLQQGDHQPDCGRLNQPLEDDLLVLIYLLAFCPIYMG